MLSQQIKSWIVQYSQHYSGLPKKCWFTIFLHCLNSTLMSICYFLPLYFTHQLNLDIKTTGFIISTYSLGTIAGGGMGGGTADKISPHIVAIISLIIEGIAFLFLALLHSPIALMINLFFLGMAAYSFITTSFLWALSYCQNSEQKKLRAINILDTSANLGLGVSALIISVLNIHTLHYLLILAGLILFTISYYVLRNAQYHADNLQTYDHSPLMNTSATFTTHSHIIKISLVISCLFLIGLIISQFSSTYPIYLHHLFPTDQLTGFGLLFALNTLLVVTLQTPLANYFRQYHRLLVIGAGAFLLGFGMFMLTLSPTYFIVVLACIVYTLGEILFFSVAQLICYENAPTNKKGFVLGIYKMIYATSRAIGPAVGSYIFQQYGSTSLWHVCGMIGVLCLLITLYFNRYVPSI
ncbi:MAG: MFS transporter [Gammaproteobacteria bacterium]|nr:MFS transporter [Gammaproteobacteria bacterium]MCW5582507.1 MFS transporter [Gammaproteobacteria bacterium]